MNTITSHEDASRYLYNEFYMGKVRIFVMTHVNNLAIADHLKNGPLHIEELARLTNTHQQTLHRIMVTAFQMGLFTMDGEIFGLTVVSELLQSDHKYSMKGLMSFMGEDYMTQGLAKLEDTLITGKPSFEIVSNGTGFYDYLAQNDTQRDNFNAAMQSIDKTVSPLLATEYNWSDVNSVVDLGGGVGSSALFVLKENEHIKSATVVEVEDVVEKAVNAPHRKHFEKSVLDKLEFKVGSMFDTKIIPQADVYMLKNIIHDWNDHECDTLLTNVVQHLDGDESKRLLVVEKIVPPDRIQPRNAGHDIVKMMFFEEQAKHRSLDCFNHMFSRNGLTLTSVTPLSDTDYYVIEGRLNSSRDILATLSIRERGISF